MKGAVAWFAENHVAANLLMILLLLAGVLTATTIKLEVFPESAPDRIVITTEYPGASPDEVVEGVIRQIEEKVAGLAGIKRIDSSTREGFGAVVIQVIRDWDLKKLLDEVKAEVDRIVTLPQAAEKPVVQEITPRYQVISVAVYGEVSEATLKHLAETMKDDLTNLPGITLAELFSVRKGEIHIEISEQTLRRYSLTLGQVADAVRTASLDLPAGSVKTSGGEILIRTKGRRYYAMDYRDVAVITRPDGTKVTLGEIARLSDGFEDLDLHARFQGKPAAVVQVYRVADQSALEVAASVKRYVDEARPGLPAGVEIDYYEDMASILKSRLRLLLRNMTLGLLLVGTLLGIFLNLRLAFWVTLGIPISFAAGLMFLPYYDVSINLLSLFAFILVLGIVVDDAIIIGENIFRKQEEGLSPLEASVEGAIEVGRPVVFSVLTTVAAFWPLLLGSGNMGRAIRNLPIVVILVLLGSLVESLFILPSHLNRSAEKRLAGAASPTKEKRAARMLKVFIEGPYKTLLGFCLRWRYATLGLGIAILLTSLGTWAGGMIKFTFFPEIESDVLACSLTLPAGTPVKRTDEIVLHLEESALKALAEQDREGDQHAPPLFKQCVSMVGIHIGGAGPASAGPEYGGHLAQVFIEVPEGDERDVTAHELVAAWRETTGPIPDAKSLIFQSELFSAGNPIEVHLSLGDHETLKDAADELKNELKRYPGVFDVNDSFLRGKEEVQLKLKPAARSLGLTLNDLALQVRHAFYGAEALRFQRDQDEVKVLVRYPEGERKSLGNVNDMRIRTREGFEVPFGEVAQVQMERGYATIERAQRRRVIRVTADVDETVTNANEVRNTLESRYLPGLKKRFTGLRYAIEGEGKEQKESMADVSRGFLIALFLIYALLAIPFGLIGALVGHLIMGYNLSFFSMVGIVGLTGVVVNDSLVLIHATNRFHGQGLSAHEAVVRAGGLRFRAIMLTSLTTFAGLTPMIVERSVQAQFLIPMALSLGFGVLFGTVVTLLLIPCNYMILQDIYGLFQRTRPTADALDEPPEPAPAREPKEY